jgi:tetratricopeptide (TPR) repeat protein
MLGNAHPDVGSDLINLSQLETQAGDYAKAEAYGREALAIYRGWFSPGHYEIAGAETTLSDPLIYQGKVQEALPLLVDALRIQQASFPGPNEKTAHTLASLGHAEHALNRLDDSLAYYQKAAAQFLSLIPGKDYRFASMLFNEGKVYKEQGRLPQAESVLRDALSVDTLRLPATDKRVLDIRLLLGEVLLEEHQLTAAQPFLTQAYKDASSAGPACETERETAEKELRSLSVAKSIPTRNP